MKTRYVDRSRVLEYQRCPRARYLGYEYMGRGIRSGRISIPLGAGTHIHAGLAELLLGQSVESAVTKAVDAYRADADKALGAVSLHLDHYDYTIAEQSALVEALVRVYALRGLPALLDSYQVLSVEEEYEVLLAALADSAAEEIVFMSRLDGVLKKRSDGGIYVLSFKTDTGSRLEDKIEDARIDLQGLSEPWALESASEKWADPAYDGPRPKWWWLGAGPIKVDGVKMEWLIKGSWTEEPRGSGLRWQDSHLIRPWGRPGPVSGWEFAWKYYTPCPGTPHKIVKADGRTWTCKGEQATHGLGDSWKRIPIWEHMPVKEWIEMLAEDRVQPGMGDPLGSTLYLPVPIFRTEADQKSRMAQVKVQEIEVARDVRLTNVMPEALNFTFRQHTAQCNHAFGGPCPFKPICFAADPQDALAGALDLGYIPRTPHHEPELIQIQGGTDAL